MNFVFMQVGQDQRAALFVQSVKRFIPKAYFVQCTDETSPEVPGVNRVYRHKGNPENLMTFRLEAFASVNLNGPGIYTDTDMLMVQPFDLSRVLGKSDAVLCSRVFGKDAMADIKGMDMSEYAGQTLGQIYPYVACFTATRSNQFWKRCAAILSGLDPKFHAWFGDQEALRNVVRESSFNISTVPESLYACLPERIDLKKPPFLLHFKGPKRKNAMFSYARGGLTTSGTR